MHAYPGFASGEVLIVGPNWLGDSIMAMPAIQTYRRASPQNRITMLVKPKMAELWAMHSAIDETWTCPETLSGIRQIALRIRNRRFTTAFILPNSFRSALLPFLGRVPERIGFHGHCRRFLLNKIIQKPHDPSHYHQQHEYAAIFGGTLKDDEPPRLKIDQNRTDKARAILTPPEKWIGLFPGAARGPAKRWPAGYFSDLGKTLRQKRQYHIAVFGSNAEKKLCARICSDIGTDALNLAGQTTLPELAALLACCAAVIGNDSGGIHLAAAAGAPVIVIYGITDPDKTRPSGRKVAVLQESEMRSRNIPRRSAEAEKSLKKISPQAIEDALLNLIAK